MARDARTWADALLRHEAPASVQEKRALALETVADTVISVPSFSANCVARFLDDPRVDGRSKLDALSSLAPGDGAWSAFCELLIRKRAYKFFPGIATAYRAALDKMAGIERVVIESPRPLDADSRQAILKAWSDIRKTSGIVATELIRPDLLGGFRFRSGSIRYDASVAGRLRNLRSFLARPLDRLAQSNEGLQ
jgi:F0F1-type ATP synthase delta subunit